MTDTENLIAEAYRAIGASSEGTYMIIGHSALIAKLAAALEVSERQRREAEDNRDWWKAASETAERMWREAEKKYEEAMGQNPYDVAAEVIEGLTDEEILPMQSYEWEDVADPRKWLADLLREKVGKAACDELTREAERLGMYDQEKDRLP